MFVFLCSFPGAHARTLTHAAVRSLVLRWDKLKPHCRYTAARFCSTLTLVYPGSGRVHSPPLGGTGTQPLACREQVAGGQWGHLSPSRGDTQLFPKGSCRHWAGPPVLGSLAKTGNPQLFDHRSRGAKRNLRVLSVCTVLHLTVLSAHSTSVGSRDHLEHCSRNAGQQYYKNKLRDAKVGKEK